MLFQMEDLENDLEVRNEFIVEFLYVTGLRVSELCNIQMQDILEQESKIRVMGKGKKKD